MDLKRLKNQKKKKNKIIIKILQVLNILTNILLKIKSIYLTKLRELT